MVKIFEKTDTAIKFLGVTLYENKSPSVPVIDVNDVPLDIPGVVDPDMPLDNTVLDAGFSRSKSSKVMDDMHTGHTAIIEEHINDTDILEAYQFLQHEIDKDNALADKADEKINRDLDVLE